MLAKTIAAVLALFITAMCLFSCDGLFGGDTSTPDNNSGNTGTNEQPDAPSDDTVEDDDAPVAFEQIVVEYADMDIADIRSAVFGLVGPVAIATDADAARKGEIVLGDTSRAVTAAAKEQLLSEIESYPDITAGYIIYYDGKSVAAYWTHSSLEELTLIQFLTVCIEQKSLELTEGVITKKLFTEEELAKNPYWLAIEASTSPEIYKALKNWYAYFDGPTTCEWLANLWDGEAGGFYYSNSARDNYPYLADLESTYQTLQWITRHGAIKSLNKELPEEIRVKIIEFAKSMQSSKDGAFYHEQWGTNIQIDRYGRDLSWATWIIETIKLDTDGDGVLETQYPNYCAPSGLKCEAHKDGGSCFGASATALSKVATNVSPLDTTVSAAVSRVTSSTVKATASSTPDYSSPEAFRRWLESYSPVESMKASSGQAHNINAIQDEIYAHGYEGVLVDYLVEIQHEVYDEQISEGKTPTGLWQSEITYKFVWGIHKYVPFYNRVGQSLIYHKEIVAACIQVILSEANGNYAMNDLMNQWTALKSVVNDAEKYNTEDLPEIEEIIKDNAVEMVARTIEKLNDFKLENGTFGYTYGGYSLSTIYGSAISCGAREADVNGQLLVGSCYQAVFTAFGCNSVPMCTPADGAMFIETITTAAPIEKIPVRAPEEITFEDFNLDNLMADGVVSIEKHTETGKIEIISDPETDSAVLNFVSPVATGDKADYCRFNKINGAGNCNIVEFDMKINSTSREGDLFQLKFGNGFMVVIEKWNGYVCLRSIPDLTGRSPYSAMVSSDAKVDADEWHRYRFEIYTPTSSETKRPSVKVFIDNELLYDGTPTYYMELDGHNYNPKFNVLQFYSMKGVATDISLDNVYINIESKAYVEGSEDISDARDRG